MWCIVSSLAQSCHGSFKNLIYKKIWRMIMNNNKKLLTAIVATVVSSVALAGFPPQPPSHPTGYFSNQTTEVVKWDVRGHDGDAVDVLNHPANPVPPQADNVEFKFYVAFTATGYGTLTWGKTNQYSCQFGINSGGVSSVEVQSNDPKYSCVAGAHFGVYPTS
jgi:hypothetical protein